ncbi:MAG TPA: heparinase II/III family protein [Candidatus Sulfotelmatobacter sp.]|nr:heparinase II/III family protein [Candidatus Sulfotelmatobacter sp.]
MRVFESISRRDLIKMMALAGAAMCRPVTLLAGVIPGQITDPGNGGDFRAAHPRLFYNAASLEWLRQGLASDSRAHANLKKAGKELLAAVFVPEKAAMQGEGQHAHYGLPGKQMSDMGLTFGLLYHLTGDRRYAEKLRDAMLYYANYVRWTGQSFERRTPPWFSELDTAKFSFGYATGYDALYDFLSGADRKTISDAMLRLSILPTLNDWVLPGRRIHSFDSMGHNWWGVCVAGAGLCSLALLGDEPRAQGWIDAMDAGFEQWFNYRGNVLQNRVATFERSGPSYEGVGYTQYGVSEYLHYRLAWQNTWPNRKPAHQEPLDHLANFFLHTLYPASAGPYGVNFNDSGLDADATHTILLLIACGLGTPEAGRYLELVQTHPDGALFSLLRQFPKPRVATDTPNSCIYPEMGWAMMRSSWENDATFLAMKSGYTWNHAHADAGSFILFKQGMPLIIDSGTCSYDREEYHDYYCQSRAHNVILFDGAGQPQEDFVTGCKFSGRMHSLIDGLGMKYVYADATGPMAQWFTRNYRHWIWSGDVIIIIDDVHAYAAGQMDWLLHFAGKYKTAPDGSVRLKNGPAEAVVKMLYPSATLSEGTGLAEHDPDRRIPYLVFSPGDPVQSRQFITAICLNPDAAPKFEIMENQSWLGVRMQRLDSVDELYLNLRAIRGPYTIDIQVGDWVTDAYLLHLSRAAGDSQPVQRFFLGDGSYLRYKDGSVMESLSKLTACWSPGDSLEIFSDTTSAPLQIAAEGQPRSVKWNKRSVTGRYDGHSGLVSLRI